MTKTSKAIWTKPDIL